MRRSLKRAAEFGLTCFGVTRFARARHTGDTLVLAYHNIVPDGERTLGDTSLHMPQHEFARQLDLLQRTHDVISLSDLASRHTGQRPRAVITFDDAYAGALSAGVGELTRRNLPATIFVTPAFIDGATFWWDRLARSDGQGLDTDVRDHGLTALAGRDADITRWARASALTEAEVPAHERGASESAMRAAVDSGAILFGAHTWSHPNLAQLSVAEIEPELTRPLDWLRARFAKKTIPYLAYPYGLYNAEVVALARRCGYQGAFLIAGGWVTSAKMTTSPFELPRWNVPAGISLRGFEIRTSGAL